jgi:hypothetical protein
MRRGETSRDANQVAPDGSCGHKAPNSQRQLGPLPQKRGGCRNVLSKISCRAANCNAPRCTKIGTVRPPF